jgi:hypothetical protein
MQTEASKELTCKAVISIVPHRHGNPVGTQKYPILINGTAAVLMTY